MRVVSQRMNRIRLVTLMSDYVIATVVRIARSITRKGSWSFFFSAILDRVLGRESAPPRLVARQGIMFEAPAQELDGAVLTSVVTGMVAFRCGK